MNEKADLIVMISQPFIIRFYRTKFFVKDGFKEVVEELKKYISNFKIVFKIEACAESIPISSQGWNFVKINNSIIRF